MPVNYNRLWKLLIDRNMKKKELVALSKVSPASVTKLGRNENVNVEILEKICIALECDIADIMEITIKESGEEDIQ